MGISEPRAQWREVVAWVEVALCNQAKEHTGKRLEGRCTLVTRRCRMAR
jgi:hypothetical protein